MLSVPQCQSVELRWVYLPCLHSLVNCLLFGSFEIVPLDQPSLKLGSFLVLAWSLTKLEKNEKGGKAT